MRKIFWLWVVCLVLVCKAAAQQKVIAGKVTGADGDPIPNASVIIKGTRMGTTTNDKGAYTLLNVPANAKALLISAAGFNTTEVPIGTIPVINVALEMVEQNLQEVVVVGYGTQKKKAVTASITRLAGEAVADIPVPSFDKALAGKAAGVQFTMGTGLTGAAPRIRIRGVNSMTGDRDPLFVIDGVPTFSSGLSGVANTNPLSDINPADIESLEILKDGAATAIYGSRAANGVILITTKKGKAGKLTVNYDAYVGLSSAFRKPKLLSAEEFVTISNEKLTNAGLAPGAFMNAENTSTDWLDQIFKDHPVTQSHTLSLSGGNDKTMYYFSLNYMNQDGIILTNSTTRYNMRGSFEHKVNKYVKFGNSITVSRTDDRDQNNGGNSLSGTMTSSMRALPNVRVFNPGHITGYNLTPANEALGTDSNKRVIDNNYTNPRYILDNNKFNSDKYRIISNAFIEVTPLAGLTIRSQASVDYQNGTDFQFLNPVHGDGRGPSGVVVEQGLARSRYLWQNYFNYNTTFSAYHTIGITGGIEMQRDIARAFNGTANGLNDIYFASDNLITNTYITQLSGGSFSKAGFQSYFGRLTYDYANKYFLQFTLRRDGLSSLSPENRYGNFPGGSIGWRLSEENFWKNSELANIMNEVKLRGSYAVVGNPVSGFPYLNTYAPAPYGAVSGNAINQVGTLGLQWETNKKIDVGAEISFLHNRINLVVDYFVNRNDDLVLQAQTPPSAGIPGNFIFKNIGTMENKGWEFSISADVLRQKDFAWNMNVNFTTSKNIVKTLVDGINEQVILGPNNGNFNILRLGEPVNGLFGYQYAGVNSGNGNSMWVKADGSLVQYNAATGSTAGYYLVIKPNDPALGAASSLAAADRKILGTPVPTWFGGLTNSFTWKGLGAEILLRFSGGNKVYNITRQEVFTSQGFINNSREILDRWTPTHTQTDVPKLFYGADNVINLQQQMNSRYLESGNFVRLQNVMLYYTFSKGPLEKATHGFIKTLRCYVQGNNLAIWTNYTGIDPENTSELGLDNNSVPQLRTITAGVNIGF